MSNALYTLAAATVEQTDELTLPSALMWLVAVGTCVMGICVVRRAMRPGKLRLRGTPGRPNRLNFLHVLILMAAILAGTIVTHRLLETFLAPDDPLVRTLSAAAGQLVGLGGALLLAHLTFRGGVVRGLGVSGRHWMFDTARAVIGYLAVLPVCVGLLLLSRHVLVTWLPELYRRMIEQNQLKHTMLQMLNAPSIPVRVMAAFSAVVLAPLSEEVFFRGIVQSMIRRYTSSPWAAILGASAFFMLVHQPYWDSLPTLFALALVLGYNYERCGRLLPPVVIHALFNAVFVAVELSAP